MVLRGRLKSKMRILITGGFGFVGGRLAHHLHNVGHQIIIGTRNQVSSPFWLQQSQVRETVWNNQSSLELTCKDIDIIIHAAGMNSQDCVLDPQEALVVNGLNTAKLASAAGRAKVKKFIYLSTAHVYSNPLIGVVDELSCPRNFHPYATSHLAGEKALINLNEANEMQSIIFRLSNSFGVPMHKEVNCWMLLINDLCRQAVQNRTLRLNTSGEQHRDFISLAVFCSVTEKLLTNNQLQKINVFNVGSGISRSVLDMAKLIQQRCNEVLNFTPELHFKISESKNKHHSLTYRTINLNKIGINLNNDSYILEIDGLLEYCKLNFPRVSI
jgi:UDP-glucose 4-epimerase